MTKEELLATVQSLMSEIEALRSMQSATPQVTVKKNRVLAVPRSTNYQLLSKTLDCWGKVPQQQKDIAAILSARMELDTVYSETAVFQMLEEHYAEYPSLANSVQSVTYLFRYYRGLSPRDGKHAGYIARNFLRCN